MFNIFLNALVDAFIFHAKLYQRLWQTKNNPITSNYGFASKSEST